MTYPVKWFSSDMEGAPVLSVGDDGARHTTTPGSLISLLKATLVTGFGLKTVSSLNYDSQTSKITATISSGHKYQIDQIVSIYGAVESGFNGEYRVLSITNTTVVFGLDNGTPSATSASGVIGIKIPSLGWSVEFEDTAHNKIIFKRTDGDATLLRLYIDNSSWTGWNDSDGFLAKVIMIENPSSISSFTKVHEGRWPCSHSYGLTDWQLIGDGRCVYFMPSYGVNKGRYIYMFGDINSVRPGDAYHCMLSSYRELNNTISWESFSVGNNMARFKDKTSAKLARSHHQMFGSVSSQWLGLSDFFGGALPFPNPSDNGFYISDSNIPVLDDAGLRGYFAGLLNPLSMHSELDKTILSDLPSIPGSKIKLVSVINTEATPLNDAIAMVAFDIKGPWR